MANTRFVYVTYIRTTPEKLWAALTEPEFTRQFWCETWQECDWNVGSTWTLKAPDGRVVDSGEVVEIEPYKRLVLTWRHDLSPEIAQEGYSRMTYTLEQRGDAVKLTVTHVMDRAESKLIAGVTGGWPLFLASVKSLLETGEALEETKTWAKVA